MEVIILGLLAKHHILTVELQACMAIVQVNPDFEIALLRPLPLLQQLGGIDIALYRDQPVHRHRRIDQIADILDFDQRDHIGGLIAPLQVFIRQCRQPGNRH
ncbi:hypothetical protein FKG94_01890 [Exilibacterium tricleocarpae]|uniref:Uncharacterized protein n=1 Tax=Exilibacterium tricleocarpae TaxID=2591008 RepID=A0A545U833_9GAMM|nr:hypothetical protein FKG94_01890 [Exilibacterium tricleocarpae]